MKRIFLSVSGLMASMLFLVLLTSFAWSAEKFTETASPETVINSQTLQRQQRGPGTLLKKADAEIAAIGFRTEKDGDWEFTHTVNNTGTVTWEPHRVQYRSSQILQSGAHIPIHTVNTANAVAPGGEISSAYDFHRCSTATQLQLDVLYQGNQLVSRTEAVPPVDVKIQKIEAGKNKKMLSVTLKNMTPFTTRVVIQAVSSKKNLSKASAGKPAGSSQVLINGDAIQSYELMVDDTDSIRQIVVLFVDEKTCPGPGYVVLDARSDSLTPHPDGSGFAGLGPVAIVQDLVWHRPTKTWTATIRNRDPYNSTRVVLAGFPMENGAPGMTVTKQATIPPNDTLTFFGNYTNYSVPAGTRLKVHVILKPENVKIHEKIIEME